MNSRQRVIGALERTPIDRVPVHLACGGPNSAIDALGGYILSSSHNLLKAFPLENILAMYDEATKTV